MPSRFLLTFRALGLKYLFEERPITHADRPYRKRIPEPGERKMAADLQQR
ncbi:MAG: hypothetical protein IPN38_10550 [Flavobacteriales bacterium]|nr:hypothetical protein [Flavobacteriales bacterium]